MSKRTREDSQSPKDIRSDLPTECIFSSKDTGWPKQFVYAIHSKPLNSMFSSRGAKPRRYAIDVVMSIPEPSEECPLTLESIADSKLSFVPDATLISDRPKHTKLTLPCKHSFSALTLLYSFCKNRMICPCCRAGEDVRMDPGCLPSHLKESFRTQVQQTLETERRQDDERGMQDAIDSFSLFGVTIPYEVLGMNGNLSMVVNFYDAPQEASSLRSSTRPIFSYSCLMRPERDSVQRITLVQGGQLRALNNLTQSGINSVQLSMQLSMQGTGNVLIDSTAIIRLPDSDDSRHQRFRMSIPGASGTSAVQTNQFQVLVQLQNNDENTPSTSFVLTLARQGRGLGIEQITWRPGTENLEILSSNVQMSAIL